MPEDPANQHEPGAIGRHVFETYQNLRFGMAAVAFAFPLILLAGGLILSMLGPKFGMPDLFMPSMSAYYHTPLRGVFVGLMFAIGFYLYLYKGFSPQENTWLNWAGTSAVLIALLPTPSGCKAICDTFTTQLGHGTSVFFFFLALVLVCRKSAERTVPLLKAAARRDWYSIRYKCLGAAIVALPSASVVATLVLQHGLVSKSVALVAEMFAVWTFGYYWYLKGREIQEINSQPVVVPAE